MLRRFASSYRKSTLAVRAWVLALFKRRTGMATLKRQESNMEREPPTRSCIACTEDEESIKLIRPCRNCETDYCVECLCYMFLEATRDNSRMPPRCCALIQIHTVLGYLTQNQVSRYRAKFEEWITPIKTYCPSPICSAFISEKRVPTIRPSASTHSLKSVLTEILTKVSGSGSARFFRGEMDITELPGFTNVVKNHIDLGMIMDNIGRYQSTNEVTIDMRLLVSNAKEYNGENHPVTASAHELFSTYLLEISNATDRLISATATPVTPQLFACPQCHIAICSGCKQVEHTGIACDISATDHEIAMLATFGYKRCPHCKAGVKKMFGCSHMVCICGAHWCYWCQRSTDECHGNCDERVRDDYDEDDDYDSEEDGDMDELPEVNTNENRTQSNALNVDDRDHRFINLDAGGARRWAETDFDFGEEPEEEPYSQIWSCHHAFKAYEAVVNDGIDRGDLQRMECNRCFEQVRAQKAVSQPVTSGKKRQSSSRPKDIVPTNPANVDGVDAKGAWECSHCHLVVCGKCRDKFKVVEGS